MHIQVLSAHKYLYTVRCTYGVKDNALKLRKHSLWIKMLEQQRICSLLFKHKPTHIWKYAPTQCSVCFVYFCLFEYVCTHSCIDINVTNVLLYVCGSASVHVCVSCNYPVFFLSFVNGFNLYITNQIRIIIHSADWYPRQGYDKRNFPSFYDIFFLDYSNRFSAFSHYLLFF